MNELLGFVLSICILALGIPIGDYLSRITKEELKSGQKWFKIIIMICFIGAIFALIWGSDALLFGFLFMAIVTSRSLNRKGKKRAKR
jgi:hypothetical protein